jgi:RNA recognition motif-containing protein
MFETRDDLNQLELVTTLTNLCECLGLVMGYYAYKRFRVRTTAIICILATIIGFLNSHLVTDDKFFMVIYPATVGFFNGIIAIIIIFPLLKVSIDKAGFLLGFSRAAFIFGVFPAYGLIKIVNPDDEEMVITDNQKGNRIMAYEPSLMGRFTKVMCYYCINILCLGVIGVLIMNRNLKVQNKYSRDQNRVTRNPETQENTETLEKNEEVSKESKRRTFLNSNLSIFAITVMYFVMFFHYNYYENFYNDNSNYKKYSEIIFLVDIIALIIIGKFYDLLRKSKGSNYSFYFNFISLTGFALHTVAINYFPSEKAIILYAPFSVLTNSIEMVVVMSLINIFEQEENLKPAPRAIQALATFSLVSVGPVIACLLNLYWENQNSGKKRLGRSDKYKEPNTFEISVSIGMISFSFLLLAIANFTRKAPISSENLQQNLLKKDDQKTA